ncbi:MAG: MBOAT family O-acyltransferase [Candidatus Omnitrophota bacterium]
MLFNSLQFALFFLIVYGLYLCLKHKWQNLLLLLASYVFYSFWDWRFLSLIILSTFFNYYLGLKINSASDRRKSKIFLVIAICLNLGMLGFFKYFNFFADNLQILLWGFGWRVSRVTLRIVLPLGISFYTFQAMSYPIDIYRRVIKPTRRFFNFALFIAFFPQLVAGPIERARNLIPQIANKRNITLDAFYGGCWLIFWGLFKKIVIADNLAKITDMAFGRGGSAFAGSAALIATYAFAFQVYADFSGYSNMARGLAKLLGFNLMVNFRVPFFSSNLYDFWQRWHISLTTWIKEYLYYPLALAKFFGRRLSAPIVVIITWAIMGLWHGAMWKFVLWGVYHGVILVIYSRIRPYLLLIGGKEKNFLSGIWLTLKILLVFHLFSVGILFFAAETTPQVFEILHSIATGLFSPAYFNTYISTLFLLLALPVLFVEFFQYRKDDELALFKWPILARAAVYYVLLYLIIMYGDFSAQKYYYFQF